MQYETHKLPSHTRISNARNALGIIAGKKKPPVKGAKFIVVVLSVRVSIRFNAKPHSTPVNHNCIAAYLTLGSAPELQISLRFGISSPSSAVNL